MPQRCVGGPAGGPYSASSDSLAGFQDGGRFVALHERENWGVKGLEREEDRKGRESGKLEGKEGKRGVQEGVSHTF